MLPEPVQAVVDSRFFVAAVVFVLTQLYNYIAKPYIDKAVSNFVPFIKKRYLLSLKDDYLAVCEYKLGLRDSSLESATLVMESINNLTLSLLTALVLMVFSGVGYYLEYSDISEFKKTAFVADGFKMTVFFVVSIPSASLFTAFLRKSVLLSSRAYIYRNFDELQKKFDELGISLKTEHDR
jgi:hypothetical protein